MYTNVPLAHVTNIIENIHNNNKQILKQKKHELLTILNTVSEQNYVKLHNQYYRQNDGLSMGASTAAIPAEVFIQYLVHTKIIEI
jgi:hypothetical protein